MTHTLYDITTLKREQDMLKEKYGIRFYNRPLLQSFDKIEHVLTTKVLPSHIQLLYAPSTHTLWASVERTDGDFHITNIKDNSGTLILTAQMYQNKTNALGIDLRRSYPLLDKTAPELREFDVSFTVQSKDGYGTKIRLIGNYVNCGNERIFFGNLRVHTMHFNVEYTELDKPRCIKHCAKNIVTDIKIRSINWSPNV